MGFWSDRDLTPEQQKQVDQIRESYEHDLEDAKLALRRDSRKEVQTLKDRIAELDSTNIALLKLKVAKDELYLQSLELEKREADLSAKEELHEQSVDNFVKIKEAHESDMEAHHDKINELQEYALTDRRAARNELGDAKNESRKAGYDEGYSDGLKDGINRVATQSNEARIEANDTAKLLALVASARTPLASTDGGTEQTPAAAALADAFAKHLTGTIDKLMAPKKESK